MRRSVISLLCIAYVAGISSVQAFLGSSVPLAVASKRNAAAFCSTSMSQDDKMGRRALLFTSLVTGVSFTSKANAAGLNLLPPALRELKERADEKKGAAPSAPSEGGGGISMPKFEMPKLGPQRKSKSKDDEAGEEKNEKPKSRMTMPKLGQRAAPKEEADETEAAPLPKPKDNTTPKPRKLKQAGMSGKEDERFTGAEVDSLEQKLLNRKKKSDEQLQEISSKTKFKEFNEVPKLNPFAKE